MKELTINEKAIQWFLSEDIPCEDQDGELYIKVGDFIVMISRDEVEYRAELWGDSSDLNTF